MHLTTSLSQDTRVVLLLTVRLTGDQERPLTNAAYTRLAKWLLDNGLRPNSLLTDQAVLVRSDFLETGIDPGQLRRLLGRGVKLALDIDRWAQRGIWVLSRSDELYPAWLRKTLKSSAPPVLFGAGDASLLNRELVGIVGSRDADEDAVAFATAVANSAVRGGFGVVSGGARGVDRAGMDEALAVGGSVVGVMAEGLESVVSSRSARDLLRSGFGCFVSMFEPDARWTVGRAMERNKLIYGLSRATFVAQTDIKGGTWEGAQENLKYGWVPLIIRQEGKAGAGTSELIKRGAIGTNVAAVSDLKAFKALLTARPVSAPAVADLFGSFSEQGRPEPSEGFAGPLADAPPNALRKQAPPESPPSPQQLQDVLYTAFYTHLRTLLLMEPQSHAQIAAAFDIPATLVSRWLKRAISDGHFKRVGRPPRIQPM